MLEKKRERERKTRIRYSRLFCENQDDDDDSNPAAHLCELDLAEVKIPLPAVSRETTSLLGGRHLMREYQATRCHRQRCTRRVASGHSSPCRRDSVVPKEYTRRLRFYGSFSAVKRPVNFPSLLSPLPFTSALPFSPLSLPLSSTRSLSLFLLFAAFCINHFISGKCRHVTTLGTRLMIFYPAWSSIFFSSTRLRLCSQKVFPPFSPSRSLCPCLAISCPFNLSLS